MKNNQLAATVVQNLSIWKIEAMYPVTSDSNLIPYI